MSDFRALSESELDRLDDDELVAYIASAREAGDQVAERRAANVLAHAFWGTICAWVRRTVPRDDVEDVAQEVLASLLRSSFDGKVIGQFGAFLRTITKRRIADYYRDRERRLTGDPLPSEHGGDDDVWGEEPVEGDEAAAVELRDVVDRVLAARSETHQEVIRLYGPNVAGFMDLPAGAVADRVDAMTPANVHQIWRRFKTDLEAELDG